MFIKKDTLLGSVEAIDEIMSPCEDATSAELDKKYPGNADAHAELDINPGNVCVPAELNEHSGNVGLHAELDIYPGRAGSHRAG